MATMTTTKWLTPIVLLVLVGVAWVWATRGGTAQGIAATQLAPAATALAQPERVIAAMPAPRHASDLAPDTQQRRSQSDAQMSAATRAMERYRCVNSDDRVRECDFEVDATAASNEVEALWLAQHGYPSRADLEEYPSLSVPELDARAAHDPAFAVLRARRRIEDGERGAGLTQLMRLAQRGDLYALYEMSRAYRHTDIYDGGAYLRLAYLFGDRRAATELYATFPSFGIPEFEMIDKRAASLRLTMFPGLTVQPRPFE